MPRGNAAGSVRQDIEGRYGFQDKLWIGSKDDHRIDILAQINLACISFYKFSDSISERHSLATIAGSQRATLVGRLCLKFQSLL